MKQMKTSIKIGQLALLWLFVMAFGCSDDFLENPPESSVTDGNFYSSDDQVLAATATLYNLVWFDYNNTASYNLGDFRGGAAFSGYNDRDNVEFKTTPTTSANGEAWRAFYNTVGQSNTTLVNINTYAGAGVSDEVKKMAIAECRFMRGLAYQFLVMNWGSVPLIENNIDLLENPLSVKRNTVETVWQFVTKDLRAAAANLPESPADEGRLTKWSAEALLAKIYLTRAGVESSGGVRKQEFLDSAKYYAQRVIEMSGASLLSHYEDLFIYPYDNNSESLFSLQWTYSGSNQWGTQNSTPAYLTPNGNLGNGDGWGGDKGATFWILSLYDGLEMIDENTLQGTPTDQRLHATFMLPGDEYPELSYANSDGETEQGYVVPEGSATSGENVAFAFVKKYVVGRLPATEATSLHYSNDTYMMRLAEVYLIYAEAELGNNASTTDATAIQYFNEVHERATGQTVSSIDFTDIFEERAKEFAMEAASWYDLVRLHYYDPERAYAIVNAQDRGLYSVLQENSEEWTIQKITWDDNRYFIASSGNFLLPLPAAEVSAAPNLLEEPVPYDFGE